MNLLALDLATRTGWASWTGVLESGVQVFDIKRGESPGMRYLRFRRWLEDLAQLIAPDLIVYEQTIMRGHGSQAPQEITNGFSTRVQELCALRAIDHAAVYPSTLKKWTTGKGNADKAAMMAAVAERWKAVTDDNESDAIALLHYALEEVAPRAPAAAVTR
jgi:Holliday junction resolvasome RuvABC endonuclease subunit